MRKIAALILALWAAPASAQIVGTLPFTLQNGTIADANQVMSDLNTIVTAVNANAANAGVNSNITALSGLTTPLVYTSGGTSTYIGGTSSGTANAQVVASPIPSGFNLIAGKSIVFVAGFTNTGPTTLNVNSTGVINVFRQGVTGPVALSGGEIALGNLVTATYDGTQFQIANASPQSLVPAGTIIDWTGVNAPSGYLRADGTAYSRTTYATLFGATAFTSVASTTTSASTSVVVPNSAAMSAGWYVGGANVTCNSTIVNVPDSTHIVISAAAGATGSTTLTIGPYPQGDCSTTFNVPNLVGRLTAMRDGVTNLTSATCTNAASVGSQCGGQTQTLTLAQLPTGITSAGSVVSPSSNYLTSPSTGYGITQFSTGTAGATVWQAFSNGAVIPVVASITSTGTLTSNNTSGTSHPILPPVGLVDKYIKF